MSNLKQCPLCNEYYGITALRVHVWKKHNLYMKTISETLPLTRHFIEDTDKIINEIIIRKRMYNKNTNQPKGFFE